MPAGGRSRAHLTRGLEVTYARTMTALRIVTKKGAALVLPLLLVASSVVVPTLDRDLFGTFPVLEAEHHPSTCVVGHDHTICQQAGGGRWIQASPTTPWVLDGRALSLPLDLDPRPATAFAATSSLPRAPPRS